jgi:hypothetical protein
MIATRSLLVTYLSSYLFSHVSAQPHPSEEQFCPGGSERLDLPGKRLPFDGISVGRGCRRVGASVNYPAGGWVASFDPSKTYLISSATSLT